MMIAQEHSLRPMIVIIDDSLLVRKMVETTLQRAGFVVQSFPDGPSALRWLAGPQAVKPALIYLDIEMPGMDGYVLARILRDLPALKQTVLAMLSCRDGVLDRVKSRLAGVQWYVTKPFRVERLVELAMSTKGTLMER